MIGYIFRNIRRSWVKSSITIIVSAALFFALGQFVVVWQRTNIMYENTSVYASFFEITTFQVELIMGTGFAKNPYFVFQDEIHIETVPPQIHERDRTRIIVVTNDIKRFLDLPVDIEFEFEPGLDMERFLTDNELYVITTPVVDTEYFHYVFELGSQIELRRFLPALHSRTFRVVGHIVSLDRDTSWNLAAFIFVPPGRSYNVMFPNFFNSPRYYDLAEFTIVDNRQINEFRERLRRMGIQDYQYIMDTSTIDRIANNLYIFETIFPVITIVLVLIGGLIPLLMILQSAKEAALLLVLGTKKSRTRLMISGQYIIICITGLIIGIFAVFIYNDTTIIFDVIYRFILCAVLFSLSFLLCSVLGVIKITHSQVLELLQVRE